MTLEIKDTPADRFGQDARRAEVQATIEELEHQPQGLIEVLIKAQEVYGYLSKEVLTHISAELHIPLIKVYGVATFYDTFTLQETGATFCRVCAGPVCAAAGSLDLHQQISGYADSEEASCLGLCDQAPAVLVNGRAHVNVTVADIPTLLAGTATAPRLQVSGEPRILTAAIGALPPTDLTAHRQNGAFAALEKALHDLSPMQVIEVVKNSRLTGRGGAGFPTGMKWEFAYQTPSDTKYAVCNFDESEPGTFKDRALMEGDPFQVLEGLLLSAYAIGAQEGFVFIRNEYANAVKIVNEAIDRLYAAGLLGKNILGSDFHFDVTIRRNAGAYICGEETAQFEAIEGQRGHPRLKPPYPTQQGLFGKPTAINNVETLAVIPGLVRNGSDWFRQLGTEKSVGLKLFSLSGHVKRPGVIEIPYGITLQALIERFGGGFDGEPQAILIGGATGGFLHPSAFNTPLTHEDLAPFDVPIGSGAIMVFNQSVDLLQIVERIAHFFVHETCGQCAPCRLGTSQLYTLTHKLQHNTHDETILNKLQDLGQTIKRTCKCGLGLTAANPTLTFLKNYDAFI